MTKPPTVEPDVVPVPEDVPPVVETDARVTALPAVGRPWSPPVPQDNPLA